MAFKGGSEFWGFRNFRSTARWGLDFGPWYWLVILLPGTFGWLPDKWAHLFSIPKELAIRHLYLLKYQYRTAKKALDLRYLEFCIPSFQEDNSSWYLTTSEVIPANATFIGCRLCGGKIGRKLTTVTGNKWSEPSHQIWEKMAILYSYSN